MTRPYQLSILSGLDKAIEKACEDGDIRFSLSSSYGYGQLTYHLSLNFLSCVPGLEYLVNFRRRNVGKIRFNNNNNNNAGLNEDVSIFNGRPYHVDADAVLLAAKTMLEIVAPYEIIAKVSILGTDHFNFFDIPKKPKLKAPRTYHTDHELSQQWKRQVMGIW